MNLSSVSPVWARAFLITGFCAIAVLAIGFAYAPTAVAQGWLISFLFVSGITIGSLVLVLIHRLTGGRWGDAFAPVLTRAASLTPWVALAFVPLAFCLSAPYHWATDTSVIRPAVARVYLNETAYLLRTAAALIGWSVLAYLVVRERCTELVAALGLVFYGFFISLVAVDWILSIDSSFSSSAFAAGIATQQILSALSFVALVGPRVEPSQGSALADLSGLVMASLLGTFYFDLMSFIVIWYGNLPEKAAWYLTRGRDGWEWLIVVAGLFGAIVPFSLLLKSSFRKNRIALRIVGGLALVGIFLHLLWLTAPAFGSGAIIATVIILIGVVALGLGIANHATLRLGRSVHAG